MCRLRKTNSERYEPDAFLTQSASRNEPDLNFLSEFHNLYMIRVLRLYVERPQSGSFRKNVGRTLFLPPKTGTAEGRATQMQEAVPRGPAFQRTTRSIALSEIDVN